MTDEQQGPSSRAPRPPRRPRGPVSELARLFLSQLLAVLAVATIITAVFAVVGANDRIPGEATGPPGRATGPAGRETSAPQNSPSPTTPVPASTSPSPAPSPSPSATERPPKVDVFNQSAGSGAAATVASGLEDRGWRTGRVDNFVGTVRTTTIYFPPGQRAAARRLAADFAQRPRLLPAFPGLSQRRLTVVLVG